MYIIDMLEHEYKRLHEDYKKLTEKKTVPASKRLLHTILCLEHILRDLYIHVNGEKIAQRQMRKRDRLYKKRMEQKITPDYTNMWLKEKKRIKNDKMNRKIDRSFNRQPWILKESDSENNNNYNNNNNNNDTEQ